MVRVGRDLEDHLVPTSLTPDHFGALYMRLSVRPSTYLPTYLRTYLPICLYFASPVYMQSLWQTADSVKEWVICSFLKQVCNSDGTKSNCTWAT